MKTLIIVAHPNLDESRTQQFLQAASIDSNVQWHALDNRPLNVAGEQRLLRQADRIIFQFPLYWYSAPASLKNWEDTVLTRAFAYPADGGALIGKQLGLVISLGQPAAHYAAGAPEQFSLSQLTVPYQALAQRLQMTLLPSFIVDQFGYQSETQKMQLLVDYQRYLTQPSLGHFDGEVDWIVTKLAAINAHQNGPEQQRLALIIDQIKQNDATLEGLQDTLTMLKEGED